MAAPGLRQSWQGSAQSDSSLNDPSRACGTRLVQQIEQSWELSIQLHDAPLNGCGRSIGKIDTLNIWTAPLQAEISEAGPVRTRRTDLLLNGKSGQGGALALGPDSSKPLSTTSCASLGSVSCCVKLHRQPLSSRSAVSSTIQWRSAPMRPTRP